LNFKSLITIGLAFLPSLFYAQKKCYFLDRETRLAYNKADSTLYTGKCIRTYRNGKMKSMCLFQDGIIQYGCGWSRKGILLDSAYYLDGFNRFKSFRYFENGLPSEESTLYLYKKRKEDRGIYQNEGTHIVYWKNGKKKTENFYDKEKGSILFSQYYLNGNLKFRGVLVPKDTTSKSFESLVLDGIHYYYHRNGNIESEMTFKRGKQHGTTVYYDENGNFLRKEEYEDGLLKE
jgi:antitoxin component YwqK of YwqJK toxin-antitoxin module